MNTNAEQIARKTLEPGNGHYAALTTDEIYSLCRAVLDAAEQRPMSDQVTDEESVPNVDWYEHPTKIRP